MNFAQRTSVILVLIISLILLVLLGWMRTGKATVEASSSPVQIAIASMSNEVVEIGWRKQLARETEPVSGQNFVVFSLIDDPSQISTLRRALVARIDDGLDYSRRGKDDGSFDVYIVRLNHYNPDSEFVTEYVTMRRAQIIRKDK